MSRRVELDDSADRTTEWATTDASRANGSGNQGTDKEKDKKSEEHLSLFWRVFGGAILSVSALAAITLYNHMSSNIAELRNELAREREARADMVKKDEFNSRNTTLYERLRGIDTLRVDIETLKERANTNTAAIEGIKKEVAGLDALKERAVATSIDLKAATTEIKTLREECQKLSSQMEKNSIADMERKVARDAQYKQIEDTLKELQKAMQDCREKLARLEGAKPVTPPAPAGVDFPLPFARPGQSPPSPIGGRPVAPGEAKPSDQSTPPSETKPPPDEGK